MRMMISRVYLLSAIFLIFAFIQQAVWYPNYYAQSGTPVVTQNFIAPEKGCNWLGVAGQVFDLDGIPVEGITILLGGQLESEDVLLVAATGSSQQMGPGGFEIQLSDHPVSTHGDLFLQIVDASGAPLSRRLYFHTVDACDQNLTVVNLIEFETAGENYLPAILNSR